MASRAGETAAKDEDDAEGPEEDYGGTAITGESRTFAGGG